MTKLLTSQIGQLPNALRYQIEGLTFNQVEILGEQIDSFQTVNVLDRWLTRLEASEGFEGEKAEMLSQLRERMGVIAPKQKQKLLSLSAEQWKTLRTLNFQNIEDLDSWLSALPTDNES